MKQITAIIRPQRLDAVEEALHALPHLPGFTLYPAKGHPRGHGKDHRYTADEWDPNTHQHWVLLVFCADDLAGELVRVIEHAARTGNPGDGMIGVVEMATAVRIRTGERDDSAV
ncbi:nitrogen regulatory protein P-II 1 [Metapseudomonas resinovorans]|uniref:P-II family nitrogen regulator n=1 Tax=Metapseudomonas resinovorans TaxID=53412 RepID=UPI0009841182|nr:P-II family nitrogen regulator [Pseudomonas resinovorans]GLZ88151.1 nitrogen regulatory protein P-II 1 [Pseudomonas resinovorans]